MKKVFNFLILGTFVSATLFVFSCNKNEIKQEVDFKTISSQEFYQVVDKVFSKLNIVVNPVREQKNDVNRGGDEPVIPCEPLFTVPEPGVTCISNMVSHTIVLPASGSRPACSYMNLKYKLTICYNPTPPVGSSYYTFHFSDFEAFPGLCPEFITWYNGLSNIDKAIEHDKWELDAFIIEEQLVVKKILSDAGMFNCYQFNTASSILYKNICYIRCLITVPVWPGFKVQNTYCGSQCCQRTTAYCLNASGILVYKPPVYQTVGVGCNSLPICPEGGLPLGPGTCGVSCGE
ncbi:MAG: hypothetical protein LC107_00985 [Chitinophagales bacterium]|nr:hypothetical protein [Chitinophagales bacterium]